jgi:hypothetical protein
MGIDLFFSKNQRILIYLISFAYVFKACKSASAPPPPPPHLELVRSRGDGGGGWKGGGMSLLEK